MSHDVRNRELPLPLQYAAMSALWLAWLAAAAWAVWKEQQYARIGLYFTDPQLILVLLLFGFPVVLSGADVMLLRRMGPMSKLSGVHRRWYCVFVCLTYFALVVSVICGGPALCMLPVQVRE